MTKSPQNTFSQNQKADWELDFYSRPILEADGKKRWELLITSSPDLDNSPLTIERCRGQVRYCQYQSRNEKTRNVLAKAFTYQWADRYVKEVLFDEPIIL